MDILQRQVRIAYRRLLLVDFLRRWKWTLIVALVIAAAAVGVRKAVDLPWESNLWAGAWIGGAAVLATLVAAAWTWFARPPLLDAALEVDRRFELRERVSSTLTLSAEEHELPAAQALVKDTLRRIERIDVAERFRVGWSRSALLPFLPAALAVGLIFLADPLAPESADASQSPAELAKQIEESTLPLKKHFDEEQKKAEDKGLKESAELLKVMAKEAQELSDKAKRGELDREQAISSLNDLAKQIAKRQESFEGQEQLKQQLSQLKQPGAGPADSLTQALKNNDFEQAADEIQKLADKLNDNKLTPEEKQKLQDQITKVRQQLQKQAATAEQAKQNLQQQQQAAQAAGQQNQANELQQQLDQLQLQLDKQHQNGPQQQQPQQLAKQLQNVADGLKNVNNAQAQQAMQNLQNQMGQLSKADQEMQMLDQAMEMIGECKGNCNGQGQGQGQGKNAGKGGNKPGQGQQLSQGDGMGGQGKKNGDHNQVRGNGGGQGGKEWGVGRGGASRPDELKDPKFRDSKLSAEVQAGKAVVTGEVGGPNQVGNVSEQIKVEVEAAKQVSAQALHRQRLPKHQREQVQEYFDALREGK